jgi:hypothetical protein
MTPRKQCCRRRLGQQYSFMRKPLGSGITPQSIAAVQRFSSKEVTMKWAGMYLVGFIVLIGGVLAALWKLGILANIGTTWTVIGVVIVIGFGIMISVSNSGSKENIEIDRN